MRERIFGFLILVSALVFGVRNSFAESQEIEFSLNLQPSLSVSFSKDEVVLDLNPLTHTFDTDDFVVTVGTNNGTGYSLGLVVNDSNLKMERGGRIFNIPTLSDNIGYREDDFPAGFWGIRVNNGGFYPVESGAIDSNDNPINSRNTQIGFGARVDSSIASGEYTATLEFVVTANPKMAPYMQDATMEGLAELLPDVGDTVLMRDRRDGNEYRVSRLADENYWMTQNLNLGRGNGEVILLTSDDSDVMSDFELKASGINGVAPTSRGDCGIGNWNASQFVSHLCMDEDPEYGTFYNLYTVTAGTATSDFAGEASSSICPRGWKLPKRSGDKSYSNLLSDVMELSGTDALEILQSEPLSFKLGGEIFEGRPLHRGVESAYHVNYVYKNGDTQYLSSYLRIDPDYGFGIWSSGRMHGYTVRCVFYGE